MRGLGERDVRARARARGARSERRARHNADRYCAPAEAAGVLKVTFADDSVSVLSASITAGAGSTFLYHGACAASAVALYCAPFNGARGALGGRRGQRPQGTSNLTRLEWSGLAF